MTPQDTEYKKYNQVGSFGSVRLEVEYTPLFHSEFQKLSRSLEKSTTVRTIDVRFKKLTAFIREHVHCGSKFRDELRDRAYASHSKAYGNLFGRGN